MKVAQPMGLESRSVLVGAAMISAAVLVGHYLARPSFTIASSGADGTTVWRVDQRDGRVSICGAIFAGSALSTELQDLSADWLGAIETGDRGKITEASRERREYGTLMQPRCTRWSTIDAR